MNKKILVKNGKELQQKIDECIKGLKHPNLGDKMLEVVRPYAANFLEIFPKREIEPILQTPFFQWFKKHENIIQAYEMLANEKFITEKDESTPLFIALEFVTANSIHFLIGSKIIYGNKKTRRAIAPLKKQAIEVTTALKVLRRKINLHQGIYSIYESKQYLLRAIVDDILHDQSEYQKSVYSSGIMKGQEIREILTKRILHGLFSLFKDKVPTPRFTAQIALKVTGVFYHPMDISDATDLAVEIRENLIIDEKFRQQTILDYLYASVEKG